MKLRITVAAVATAGLILTATITTPITQLFGKHYDASKDFTCCQKDQLVIHHYYTFNLFGIKVTDGFTNEETGKALPGECNIKCVEE